MMAVYLNHHRASSGPREPQTEAGLFLRSLFKYGLYGPGNLAPVNDADDFDALGEEFRQGTSIEELHDRLNQRLGSYYPPTLRNQLAEGGKVVLPNFIPGGAIARGVGWAFRAGASLSRSVAVSVGLARAPLVGSRSIVVATGEGGAGVIGQAGQATVRTAPAQAGVQANRAAGNAFRDEVALGLRNAGRGVRTEVYKWTPFGPRYIDIEVSLNGTILGGIETKLGGSRYTFMQYWKDLWLLATQGYRMHVLRAPR
jgi:hypothetical protein